MFNKTDLKYIKNTEALSYGGVMMVRIGYQLTGRDSEVYITMESEQFQHGRIICRHSEPVGPTVAIKEGGEWIYKKSKGGLEVWMGKVRVTTNYTEEPAEAIIEIRKKEERCTKK